jgi:hypothetical protein
MQIQGARDIQMVERAVAQRWPIAAAIREGLVLQLQQFVFDDKRSLRARLRAAQTLVIMERQNQADEHKLQPDRQLNLSISPEQLANMSDEELESLERRLLGKD